MVSLDSYECKGLGIVSAVYSKQGRRYRAVSYYADAWIGKHPMKYTVDIRGLASVAKVTELKDGIKVLATVKVLEQVIKAIEDATYAFSKTFGDGIAMTAVYTPMPHFVVKVVDSCGLLVGTFSILPNGEAIPITRNKPELDTYIKQIAKARGELNWY